ncbi:MAG: kelch repeat-containing protein, partial [bacterium]
LFDISAFVTYQVFEYEVLQAVQFEQIAVMPNPRSYSNAAVVGDLIYVIGGIDGIASTDPMSIDIDSYDPAADIWDTTLAPMPTARAGMAVESVGNLIYVIGGLLDGILGETDVMEVYNTTDDSWETRPTPLPGPKRHGMGTTVKDSVIYVFGGKNSSEKELNVVYRFDTVLESWGALNPMTAKRTQFACVLKDDSVYVAGGNPVVGPGSDLTPLIEVYDTIGGEWSYPPTGPSIADIAPDPYEAILAPCWENVQGKIVFAGGAYALDLLEEKVYIYNELTETFMHVGQLVLPRASFASVSWNNQIFLFGGVALSDDIPPIPYLTSTAEKGTL